MRDTLLNTIYILLLVYLFTHHTNHDNDCVAITFQRHHYSRMIRVHLHVNHGHDHAAHGNARDDHGDHDPTHHLIH